MEGRRVKRWTVRPIRNGWGIYDPKGAWHDTEATFDAAVRLAHQYAICERICKDDGLEWFARKTGWWKIHG